MAHYKLSFLLVFFFIFTNQQFSKAQGFGIPDDACPNIDITFTNPGSSAATYEWDFCTGDLSQSPSATAVLTSLSKAQMSNAEGITTVFDGTDWYGFYTNRDGNTLSRMKYGSSLTNTPGNITNLGNPGGFFAAPRTIDIFKEGSKWYGIALNLGGRIMLLDFDTSLTNVPTATQIPAYTQLLVPADAHVVRDGSNTYLVVINYSTTAPNLVVLDYGSSITNSTPTITATNTFALKEGYSVRAMKDGNNWYAFASSLVFNDKTHPMELTVLNFGNTLHNTSPTTKTYTPAGASATNFFYEVIPVTDGANRHAMGITPDGNIYRFSFGNSFDNTPTIDDLGYFDLIGGLGAKIGSSCLSLVKEKSKWYGFTLNSNTTSQGSQLIRIDFQDVVCDVNNTIIEGNQTTVQNSFINPNKYRISLTNRNSNGTVLEYFTDSINIDASITPGFLTSNICLGETMTFTNQSVGSDSDVLAWEWSFGDGTNSALKSPTHTYAKAGVYNISLTARTVQGKCDNPLVKTVKIREVPKADFALDNEPAATSAITFNNTSTVVNENAKTSYYWLFDDGTFSLNKTPVHTYSKPGTYNVSLTVTDTTGGCSSVMSKSITIGAIPDVGFSMGGNACTQTPITFTDTSSVSDNVGSTIVSYQWNFGNSKTSTEKNPTVTFDFVAPHEITLTVTTNLGVSKTVKKTVNFQESSIQSTMSASVTSGDAPLGISFTNQTTGASSYSWDFGDGSTSTVASPSHVYSQPGIYTATFRAYGSDGCSKPVTQQIIVSAVNAVTEIALTNISVQNDSILVQVTNNGNDPVITFNIRAILNGSDTLTGQWNGELNSLQSMNYVFALKTGQGSLVSQVCATIIDVNAKQDAKTTDNSLCKNTLDAQISNALIQDGNYIISIKNNAEIPVQKLKIRLDFGDQTFDSEWTGSLGNGQQTNYIAPIPLSTQELANSPFFCAVILQVNDTTDAVATNNVACQEYSNSFSILGINPNPAIDFINIDYFLPSDPGNNVVQLQITNSIGRVMGVVQLLHLIPGRNTYQYRTASLGSGVYNLIFIRGNRKITKKIIIR